MQDRIQKLAERAGRAGIRLGQPEFVTGDGSTGLKTALTTLVGGTVRADTLCRVVCQDHAGKEAVLYQPWLKGIQMPGELHATIDGAVQSPLEVRGANFLQRDPRLRIGIIMICVATVLLIPVAIYLAFFHGRPTLVGRDGKAVTVGAETTAALKRLRFGAAFGSGRFYSPWLIQLWPAGHGRSHIVMSAADYGGLINKDPGFDVFYGICRALSTNLPKGDNKAGTPLRQPRFSETNTD